MHIPVSKLAPHILKHAPLILFTGMLQSCQYSKSSSYMNEETSLSIPHIPFNIEQAVLINQYTTPSSRTTSWVLADSGNVNHQSIAGFFKARGKDKLCLLHWSQTDDPVWIGARIPGRFLWADLIIYERDTLVIKQYQPNGEVIAANETYKTEVEKLLREVNTVRYP